MAGLKYYACAVARCGGAGVLAARTATPVRSRLRATARTPMPRRCETPARPPELGLESAPVAARGTGGTGLPRLEAGMPLYGHELSTESPPVEAGLASSLRWPLRKRTRPGPAPWATTPWLPCCRTLPSAP
ncbi:hypothetical protein QJS66_20290 [Kocuria rhizophila]|nr:hypothetical protein QJS66_20290 [Kocuria rhizophila]